MSLTDRRKALPEALANKESGNRIDTCRGPGQAVTWCVPDIRRKDIGLLRNYSLSGLAEPQK